VKKDMVSFMRACLLGSLLVMFLIISLNCLPSPVSSASDGQGVCWSKVALPLLEVMVD
jgi:hypothetical protein